MLFYICIGTYKGILYYGFCIIVYIGMHNVIPGSFANSSIDVEPMDERDHLDHRHRRFNTPTSVRAASGGGQAPVHHGLNQ